MDFDMDNTLDKCSDSSSDLEEYTYMIETRTYNAYLKS